jgi:hypothetical protein
MDGAVAVLEVVEEEEGIEACLSRGIVGRRFGWVGRRRVGPV